MDYDAEEVNPETGWSYGIDDMAWFPAKEGLSALSLIWEHLIADGLHPIPEEVVRNLLGEIESCIAKLVGPASRDAKFHFAVLM